MRRLTVILVTVGLVSTSLLSADALAVKHLKTHEEQKEGEEQKPVTVTSGTNKGAIRVDASASGGTNRPPAEAPSRSRRTAPLYRYEAIVQKDDGSYCMRTRYTRDQTKAALYRASPDTGNILAPTAYAPCPRAPRPLREVARELSREFWDERELPSPTLRAAPGWAITGKPVYLEILGDRERTIEVDNPIGPDVVIHATSEYVIDWGDPYDRKVTRTRSPGGPWPHGDVTHVYTDVGTVTITVTQRWRATWKAGREEGTLEALRTEGSLPDFRVVQLQAVRRR